MVPLHTLEEQQKLSVTQTSRALAHAAFPMRLVASLILAAGGFAMSAPVASAQSQLPPGFYSFAPSKQDTVIVSGLSTEAERDYKAAMIAYSSKDYAGSIALLQQPAKEGSIQANWLLAHMLRTGLAGYVDEVKAYQHYNRIANDFVNKRAQVIDDERYFVFDSLVYMGVALHNGRESAAIAQDMEKALHFYQIAGSAGHPRAQYGFAMMFLNGDGVSRDRAYGIRWLGTSAQKRYAPAASKLGDIYAEEGDLVRALVWYRVAADTADQALSTYVLAQHESIASALSNDGLARADQLYNKWTRRFPIRQDQAKN